MQRSELRCRFATFSNKNSKKGFTLIEALTLLFIFSLITITFYNVISLGTRYIQMSKNKLGAVAVLNEKMEIIRNLEYGDVGTVGGTVSGNILQEEEVTENGKNYEVRTLVQYMDDPFDGTLGGSPNDIAYKDYKIVKVSVSWNNGGADSGEVSAVSNFVSPSLEVASAGDGILVINVFSSQDGGSPVTQASVHIQNPDVGIDQTVETDDSGSVSLVGAKESIQRYKLTVSKSGYETVTTYPPYPDTAFNPINVNASVIEGTLNVSNIDMNRSGRIRLKVVDYLGNPVEGLDYTLFGGKKIGTEVAAPYSDILSTNVSDSTDSDGEEDFDDLSPGQYEFDLADSEDTYQPISSWPASPFNLEAGEDLELNVRVVEKNMTSLSVKIKDSEGQAIDGAQVRLSSSALGIDTTVETGEDGISFFPVSEETPLVSGTYDMEISADGFDNSDGQIDIVDGAMTEAEISLSN